MKKIKHILLKNWLLVFCLIIIVLQFSQIAYFKRALLLDNYDSSYWKDRFEHSQYALPASARTIGDDGLYSYAGYRLTVGNESIEKTATFKPPVGIYSLGFSTVIFNNPLITTFLISIATIIIFFFLSRKLLNGKKPAIIVTTLLALDPFIFSNFTIALLDLPQLFFLILHLLFFVYSTEKKRFALLFALISGLSLGFFTETKLPLLLPIIILLETLYLIKKRLFLSFIFLVLSFCFGVLVPYLRYFELGNSLIDYLKLHKYFLFYYASGKNQLFPLAIWQSLFIGYFPDVVSGKLNRITDWWPILPLATFFGLAGGIKVFFQKNSLIFLRGLSILVFTLLAIYTLIPSYARYLVLVIPFLYILAASLFKKYTQNIVSCLLFIVLCFFGLAYSSYLLLPNPENTLWNLRYNFSHRYLQDVYQEQLSLIDHKTYSRQEFRAIAQSALEKATIKNVDFKELSRNIPVFGEKGYVKYLVTYTTQNLGKFSETKTIDLVKEQDQWKIVWNWNIVFNSFKPDYTFSTNLLPGKRGTIQDKERNILATDAPSILISINPDKIDTKREQKMLKLLQDITSKPGANLQNAYLENPLPNTYIPVATPFIELTTQELDQLNSFPGLKTEPYISRLYTQKENLNEFTIVNTVYPENSSRIYSSSNYHGISGIEKKYDKELSGYNGGTLQMLDGNGNIIRTLLNREPKNGEDITLP
ncbi:MAG: hypothetical protein COY68_03590 [Candidatus Levybacteria bacterium CG_4_10_14_0_8_um_filter_35_23]|nr:MAG: hypothetical protein COY68_03590 [Candidatus Levybacteria bacterium CG_4_10_14_0_8_um_filter_35_23]